MARMSKKANSASSAVPYDYIWNHDRPNKEYTIGNAKQATKAIMLQATDHHDNFARSFGPIPAEHY